MKKFAVGTIVVAVAFLAGTMAFAARQGSGNSTDVNSLRQFQKETLPLRDEVAAKGLELRNEYTKETPDQAKITKLQDEIAALRTKIDAAAEKAGIAQDGWGRGGYYGMGPGMMYGYGYGRGGMRGGYGHGWMMGQGYGRGGDGPGYCPMW